MSLKTQVLFALVKRLQIARKDTPRPLKVPFAPSRFPQITPLGGTPPHSGGTLCSNTTPWHGIQLIPMAFEQTQADSDRGEYNDTCPLRWA